MRVLDHGTEVESELCRPIRLTPDGYAGVAYAGSVCPLRQGDLIDLDGSSWELADCDRFLFTGAEVPYAPLAGEALEAAGSGSTRHTIAAAIGADETRPWDQLAVVPHRACSALHWDMPDGSDIQLFHRVAERDGPRHNSRPRPHGARKFTPLRP